MESTKLLFIIIVILIGISVVAATVFLIIVLIHIKKTVKEFENTIRKINSDLDFINKIPDKFASVKGKLLSLAISVFSILYYTISGIIKNRKGRK
jgi:uncharacterized protein YoxC